MQVMWVCSLGREDPLEKDVATHSRILAWKIPRTEKPGGPQSTGSQKSHDLETKHQQMHYLFTNLVINFKEEEVLTLYT